MIGGNQWGQYAVGSAQRHKIIEEGAKIESRQIQNLTPKIARFRNLSLRFLSAFPIILFVWRPFMLPIRCGKNLPNGYKSRDLTPRKWALFRFANAHSILILLYTGSATSNILVFDI